MKKFTTDFTDLRIQLKNLSESISFEHPDITQSKPKRIEHLYWQMEQVINIANITGDDLINDMGKLLEVLESPCTVVSPGLAALLTCHFNLCLGTIITLAGENKKLLSGYINELETLSSQGIYMVTELDAGNNAMSLQTSAHYDEDNNEFIINTPNIGACKFMPYLSSNKPKIAVVMARLWIKNKDLGVHPFIIRCRDKDGKLLPGIKVSDLPVVDIHSSYACEADHSITSFHNVRIPYFSILTHDFKNFSSNTIDSILEKSKREIFLNSLSRVGWGKIGLVAGLIPNYKIAIACAIEHAKNRVLSGRNNSFTLLDIQTHKLELSNAYVLISAAISLYEKTKYDLLTQEYSDNEFHHKASIVKAMCVEIARDGLNICMARTGAQGKLLRNRIAPAVSVNDHISTVEGDSLPVLMKIAKDLIDNELDYTLLKKENDLSLTSTIKLLQLILLRVKSQKDQLSKKLSDNLTETWNKSTQLARELAWAYGIYETALTLANRPELQRNFCIRYILDEAAWYSANEMIESSFLRYLLAEYEEGAIKLFNQEALLVAYEFDVIEQVKRTPIGNKDKIKEWTGMD